MLHSSEWVWHMHIAHILRLHLHTHYIAYELHICLDFSYTFTLFNEYKETIHSEDAYLSYEKKRVWRKMAEEREWAVECKTNDWLVCIYLAVSTIVQVGTFIHHKFLKESFIKNDPRSQVPDDTTSQIPDSRSWGSCFRCKTCLIIYCSRWCIKMLLAERCKNGPYMRERVFGRKTDDCLVCICSGLL